MKLHPDHLKYMGVLFAILAVFLPFGYWIKSFSEPSDWWINSAYHPIITLAANEVTFSLLAVVSYYFSRKEKKP